MGPLWGIRVFYMNYVPFATLRPICGGLDLLCDARPLSLTITVGQVAQRWSSRKPWKKNKRNFRSLSVDGTENENLSDQIELAGTFALGARQSMALLSNGCRLTSKDHPPSKTSLFHSLACSTFHLFIEPILGRNLWYIMKIYWANLLFSDIWLAFSFTEKHRPWTWKR